MIQAVIFDMDGVLFDTERLAVQSWEKAGLEFGIKGMGDIVPHVLGFSQKSSWPMVQKFVGKDFPYDDFRRRVHDHSFAYFDEFGVPVKKGVQEALQYLKDNGYRTAVATSTRRESAMHHFQQTGLKDYFDAFVCGDEVKNGKPAPDIFLIAADKLGVNPKNCMVIEDSPNGLKAAFAAGVTPVMVPDLIAPNEKLAQLYSYVIDSLSDLPKLLESVSKQEIHKTTEEYLEELRILARKNPDLKQKLLATQQAEQPLACFCTLANEQGILVSVGDMIKLGEEYYDNLFKSCNGAAVTPLEGWEDAYEMFIASLF